MLDQKTSAEPLREEDGAIRADIRRRASRRRSRPATPTRLRALVGDLHEADLGAVLEALEPDERPRLIELLGIDFDFTALTEVDDTVREEILDELPPQTVAEGVRELEFRRRGSDPRRPAARKSRPRSSSSCRRSSASRWRAAWNIRKTPPAGACRPSSSRRRRPGPSASAIDYMRETEELPERFYELYVVDDGRPFPRRRAARPFCCAPSARCRSPN